MLIESGEGMGKKSRSKYPWELLKKKGDYFIWGNASDGNSIRACAPSKGYKITVNATLRGGNLCVIVTRVS